MQDVAAREQRSRSRQSRSARRARGAELEFLTQSNRRAATTARAACAGSTMMLCKEVHMSLLRLFTVVRRGATRARAAAVAHGVRGRGARQIMRSTGARVVRVPHSRCAVGSSRRASGGSALYASFLPREGRLNGFILKSINETSAQRQSTESKSRDVSLLRGTREHARRKTLQSALQVLQESH